jgi:hypothetical protein
MLIAARMSIGSSSAATCFHWAGQTDIPSAAATLVQLARIDMLRP